MNVYQKIAVGGFVMLVVALSVTTLYSQDALLWLTVFALAVALLVFSATWKLIFLSIQAVGILVGGIGHAVADLGDVVADWSEGRRVALGASPSPTVPDWDNPELRGGRSAERSDEGTPSFVEGTMESQNS